MIEYYSTGSSVQKLPLKSSVRPPIISPIQRNLLRIDIYNPLGLISLSSRRDDCFTDEIAGNVKPPRSRTDHHDPRDCIFNARPAELTFLAVPL